MASPIELLLLIAVGRVLIYLWGKFPLPEWFDNSKFGKLHHCQECAGTWIYSVLFILFRVDILNMLGLPSLFIIGGFISGGLVSFVMSLLEIGFRERFMTIRIE
jgi:hypothetical protein